MKKNKISLVLGYLGKYRSLSVSIFLFVAFGSFLEVFSVGLLLPILQGMMGSQNIFNGIPVLRCLNSFFNGWDRKDLLTFLLLAFFIIFTLKNMVFYMGNVIISKQRFLLTRDLQKEFFDKLMHAGVSFYDSIKSGHVVNSIYNETVRIGNFINCTLRVFAMFVRMFVNAVILFIISWQFTILALLAFFAIRFPLHIIMNRIREIGIMVNKKIADLTFTMLEAINGIRIIKIFSGEDKERAKFAEAVQTTYNLHYANIKNAESILPLTQIAFFGIFIIFFLVLLRTITMDLAKIIPYVAAYLYVSKNVLTDFGALQDRRAEALSYLGALDSYNEMTQKIDAAVMPDGAREFVRINKEIRFDNVSFGYNADKKVLDGLSFSIPKNKTTALVGSSGSGKTTLAYLLLRFYDAVNGRVLVDDCDIRELSMKSWRSKIGFVSQDVFIFNASAKENITYGKPDATDAQVRSAAMTAEIDTYISGLPNGYDTILGERGIKLSGGQRQRISIARALIQNPEILILDEATSHLDTKTERQIQRAIEKLSKDRTVIVIAHRLSTILEADNILVLGSGKILESGKHADLIRSGGQYKNLYETQFETAARNS